MYTTSKPKNKNRAPKKAIKPDKEFAFDEALTSI